MNPKRLLAKLEKFDPMKIPTDIAIELISAKQGLKNDPSTNDYEFALTIYHKIIHCYPSITWGELKGGISNFNKGEKSCPGS